MNYIEKSEWKGGVILKFRGDSYRFLLVLIARYISVPSWFRNSVLVDSCVVILRVPTNYSRERENTMYFSQERGKNPISYNARYSSVSSWVAARALSLFSAHSHFPTHRSNLRTSDQKKGLFFDPLRTITIPFFPGAFSSRVSKGIS